MFRDVHIDQKSERPGLGWTRGAQKVETGKAQQLQTHCTVSRPGVQAVEP